jgi:hypothetical protein
MKKRKMTKKRNGGGIFVDACNSINEDNRKSGSVKEGCSD